MSLGRRRLFGASTSALWLSRSSIGEAKDFSGVAAIDTPSIQVKTLSGVVLVAITRCGDRLIAVGEQGVIIYSDDDGNSWTQASVPVNLTLTCISFVTSKLGWAAGHFGVILFSADAGKTWITQLTGIASNKLTLNAAKALNLNTNPSPGGPLALVRAQHFLQEGPDKPFLSLLTFSSEKVIAFGAYRMSMITSDGGQSWNDWSLHIYDKLSHNIYDAQIVNNQIYLVGEEGLVFHSSDAGETFLPVASPSPTTIFGLVAANDGSIVVFGVAGSCFRSADMGDTWTQLNLGSQDNLTAGRLLDSGILLIASEAGALFLSKDNGLSFEQVMGVRQVSIFDFEETVSHDIVIVGATGTMLVPSSVFNV